MLWCCSELPSKAWPRLSGPAQRLKKHSGGNRQCACSMSTWDGDEFWEILGLKIGWVCGSHLLGNSSLYYETIMCCDYISDKGNQRCCQIVSAEVFQCRRSSLCSSWLWLVFVSWLGQQDNFSCAFAHWRMGSEHWGTGGPAWHVFLGVLKLQATRVCHSSGESGEAQ